MSKFEIITRDPIDFGYTPRYTPVTTTQTEERDPVQISENHEPILEEVSQQKEEGVKFSGKKDFAEVMLPLYKDALRRRGLNPEFAKSLVAQDGLESAWGTRPSGTYNFGGIKGRGTSLRTREVINGKDTYITDSFRNFDSLNDYVDYKVDLLNNNRYKAFSGTVNDFANRVKRGGYATDPRYIDSLQRTIASLKRGGVLKMQRGGTGEIKPVDKSWISRKIDDLATAYNTSDFAKSAVASVLAWTTPFGVFHYSMQGNPEEAKLAMLPAGVAIGKSPLVAEQAVKGAKAGIDAVYAHYGDDISKYMHKSFEYLRNKFAEIPSLAERIQVPKRITKIEAGPADKFGHDYSFFIDKKTGDTVFKINPASSDPARAGRKGASKQILQELVGTKEDFGLQGLSPRERGLFSRKYVSGDTRDANAKDIYSRIMSDKVDLGIKSNFDAITEPEAKRLFDRTWQNNLWIKKGDDTLKESFWNENKKTILNLFKRIPAFAGVGMIGKQVISEQKGGTLDYSIFDSILSKWSNTSDVKPPYRPYKEINWKGLKTTRGRGYNPDNINYIYRFFKDRDYNDKQIASILGQMAEESGFDPLIKSKSSEYQGLLQWGNGRYHIKNSDSKVELDEQLNMLDSTLRNTTDRMSWHHGGKGSGYAKAIDAHNTFWNPDASLQDIHHSLSRGYVRPRDLEESYRNRQKVVDQIYKLITE